MKTLKEEFNKMYDAEAENLAPEPAPKLARLTEKNLKRLEEANNKGNEERNEIPSPDLQHEVPGLNTSIIAAEKKAKKSKKGREKPKWAMTEKEVEDLEAAEVDDLLNFANDLDYEQYVYDVEVRSMMGALKNRIQELKHQDNWKNKVVEEWNKAGNNPQESDIAKQTQLEAAGTRPKGVTFDDNRSEASDRSKSNQSVFLRPGIATV